MWKKNSSSKYLRSWNLRSKLYLVSCFYTSLLMIGFEDLILIYYIWVPNLTIEAIMKKINFKQHFATTYRPLTKKTTAFAYRSTCLIHCTMLAPIYLKKPLEIWDCITSWRMLPPEAFKGKGFRLIYQPDILFGNFRGVFRLQRLWCTSSCARILVTSITLWSLFDQSHVLCKSWCRWSKTQSSL